MTAQTATVRHTESTGTVKTALITFAITTGILLLGAYMFLGNLKSSPTGPAQKAVAAAQGMPTDQESLEYDDRASRYIAVMAKRRSGQIQVPANPQNMIIEFWSMAAQKDWGRMCELCPGSRPDDFSQHYAGFSPQGVKSFGKPYDHPEVSGVAVYPTVVAFPGFPEKEIKMAIGKEPGEMYFIDGRYTEWW